jgi:hypothetical protein
MPLQITIPQGTGTTVGTGITTYSGLVASIERWLNRSDLGTVIPDFITLVEDRLNRLLRAPDMENIVTLTVSSGSVDLPTDFLEARHLYVDADPNNEIVPASLDTFQHAFSSSQTGRPQVYAVSDGQLMFAPSPDATYSVQLHYYKRIPALSASNETNWLITTFPSLYLWGSLVMAEAFIWDDDRIPLWKGAWDEALAEFKRHGTWKRHGGGPLAPRIPVCD